MQFQAAPSASPTVIHVRVRLFAQYAELLGSDAATVELPAGATVADAVAAVRGQLQNGHLLPERPLAAINLAHALAGQRLADGDEVAVFPALAGG